MGQILVQFERSSILGSSFVWKVVKKENLDNSADEYIVNQVINERTRAYRHETQRFTN